MNFSLIVMGTQDSSLVVILLIFVLWNFLVWNLVIHSWVLCDVLFNRDFVLLIVGFGKGFLHNVGDG